MLLWHNATKLSLLDLAYHLVIYQEITDWIVWWEKGNRNGPLCSVFLYPPSHLSLKSMPTSAHNSHIAVDYGSGWNGLSWRSSMNMMPSFRSILTLLAQYPPPTVQWVVIEVKSGHAWVWSLSTPSGAVFSFPIVLWLAKDIGASCCIILFSVIPADLICAFSKSIWAFNDFSSNSLVRSFLLFVHLPYLMEDLDELLLLSGVCTDLDGVRCPLPADFNGNFDGLIVNWPIVDWLLVDFLLHRLFYISLWEALFLALMDSVAFFSTLIVSAVNLAILVWKMPEAHPDKIRKNMFEEWSF